MTDSTNKPFKSLDLDDFAEFKPRASAHITAFEPVDEVDGLKPIALAKKPTLPQTVFPSREPGLPKYQQLNMHIRSEVAERFKALAVRDQYTTWKYGQIVEFLLDHYEKNR